MPRKQRIPVWVWWVLGVVGAGGLSLAMGVVLLMSFVRHAPLNQTLVDTTEDVKIGMYWGEHLRLNREAKFSIQLDVQDGAPVNCLVLSAAEKAAFDVSKIPPKGPLASGLSGTGLSNYRDSATLAGGEWYVIVIPQHPTGPFVLISSSKFHLKVTLSKP